jgi:hypothetical protein
MSAKSVASERLWHCVRKNLDQQCLKLNQVFGDEKEFIRRYLPEFSHSDHCNTTGSSQCAAASSTELSAHTSPLTRQYGRAGQGANQEAKMTPLMDLLHEIGTSGEDPKAIELEASMKEIIRTDEAVRCCSKSEYMSCRDKEGNTALHYAAEFGIVSAVKYLCDTGKVRINVLNNCGNTPLQLVKYAIQRTDVKCDINMESRYLRCAVLLLTAGAKNMSNITNEPSILYDGSERSIEALVRQGVAQRCRGLHLLSP